MEPLIRRTLHVLTLSFLMLPRTVSSAEEPSQPADNQPRSEKASAQDGQISADATPKSAGAPKSEAKSASASPAKPGHERILAKTKKLPGLLTLHHKGNKLYAELKSANYSSEYIVMIAISKGIGQQPVLAGMTWGFGDDWVWQFRKVNDRVHVVRKNVRFRAKKGKPVSYAVKDAFTDSVLYSLPIAAKGPEGGDLIDLSAVFLTDLPQISRYLTGFSFSATRSNWASVKAFPHNVELEVAATYASSGRTQIDSVPDTRGVTINVHYSISAVPKSSYQPRLADDRVGYFITAAKDFSKTNSRDRFVRYINRWDLQKVEAGESLTPPKTPIRFYLEKTIPYKYRKPIREGILEWNKAFEAIGFANAIEVIQQDDDDTRDPEDVRFNFFRWITSSQGFAMGPSRTNPYTGQILDADIIFDADFLQFWKEEFQVFVGQEEMTNLLQGNPWAVENQLRKPLSASDLHRSMTSRCMVGHGMANQLAFGITALAAAAPADELKAEQEKLIMQGLKETTMHEVGHTLGLRHNFRASTYRSLKDLNDPSKNQHGSLSSSVMDYAPVNVVPKGTTQGAYYSTTIGPYDTWAIEYGYKPLTGGTDGESKELAKIAARSGEPALAFATDEDAPLFLNPYLNPDPRVSRYDLGDDPVAYARRQHQIMQDTLPNLVERMTKDGENYTQVRRAFLILLSTHSQAMQFVARNIGGLKMSRSHRGDKDAEPPFALVDAKVQRESLELLNDDVLGPKAYDFPPELYNQMGASRWFHWGTRTPMRPDFPVHSYLSIGQLRVLGNLMSSTVLTRIHDSELKVDDDEDIVTVADLLHSMSESIFSEVKTLPEGPFTNRKPAINSLRRNLQKIYMRRLADLALGRSTAPNDCQTLAFLELGEIQQQIDKLLENQETVDQLDRYSLAHLRETTARIGKVLDADLSIISP